MYKLYIPVNLPANPYDAYKNSIAPPNPYDAYRGTIAPPNPNDAYKSTVPPGIPFGYRRYTAGDI